MNPGKNYKALLLVLPITIALILGSCASKPPEPEPEPLPVAEPQAPPEPVAEPVQEAPAVSQAELDSLLEQAKELKKKSFDLKLFELLPEDYKAAEGSYALAFEAYNAATKDPKEGPAAKAKLEACIAAYEDLLARGIVQLAEAKRGQADAMKAASLKVGADAKAVERFDEADMAYVLGQARMNNGDSEGAIEAFERARLYYELAYKRSVASDLRDEISVQDYEAWDSGNYQLAENKYAAEEGLWASGRDREAGVDMLDEAILRFNLVIQKGRQSVASGVKVKTDDSKQRAEEIKANVAVKDEYNAALELYKEGTERLSVGDYEEATAILGEANYGFEAAYESAADKRATALAAMAAAEAAAADSARKAEEADKIVEQASGQ